MLTAPAGKSLVSKTWYNSAAIKGYVSEGTTTAALPAASTGITSDRNPSSGSLIRADDPDRAERLIHGQRDVAEGRVVHRPVELVRPRRIGKDALDAETYFGCSLSFSDHCGQAARNLFTAQ